MRPSHYPVNRQLIRRGLRGAEGNDWRMPSRPGNPLRALGTNGAGSALGAGGASGAGLALGAGRALRTSRPRFALRAGRTAA